MAELLRGYLQAVGKHRLIFPLTLPGKAARAFRAGANLAPDRAVGRRTWEDFLAARVSSPSDSNQWDSLTLRQGDRSAPTSRSR